MASYSQLSILVDRSVDYRRFITEPASTEVSTKWGDTTQQATLTGWKYKGSLASEHEWLNNQISYLPTIGRLAREGRLKLYTTPELQMEGWTAERKIPWGNRGDLFDGVEIGVVRPAVDRSYFRPINAQEMVDRKAVRIFCQFLLEFDGQALRSHPLWTTFPLAMKNNLDHIDRFRFLCAKAGDKHHPDVLHFWTAETEGLAHFLTLDRKLLNIAKSQSGFVESTGLVSPSMLLDELGIADRDPMPLLTGHNI